MEHEEAGLGGNSQEKGRDMVCRTYNGNNEPAWDNIRHLDLFSKGFEKKYTVMIERIDFKTEGPNSNFGSVFYILSV